MAAQQNSAPTYVGPADLLILADRPIGGLEVVQALRRLAAPIRAVQIIVPARLPAAALVALGDPCSGWIGFDATVLDSWRNAGQANGEARLRWLRWLLWEMGIRSTGSIVPIEDLPAALAKASAAGVTTLLGLPPRAPFFRGHQRRLAQRVGLRFVPA